MNILDIEKQDQLYVMQTYKRMPVCFVKGKGSRLWDVNGKEYLDFFPGWAVSGLGHCPSEVMSAVRHQVGKLIHLPNNYLNLKQIKLAEVISEHTFPSHVFFCNSGAEAVESAIKLARKYGSKTGRYEMITMKKSFHGRTLAALTATGQERIHEGFKPLPEGFRYAELNDFSSVEKLVNDKTVAILVEPIQGEGGVRVATDAFLKQLKDLCQKKDLLLIFDEIQTGMGRTGKMFAYQHSGIEPDAMTLAKSLGGGLPIGALVVQNRLADVLGPGTHASTFGGNPVVCAAALAVFKAIEKKDLLNKAKAMGAYLVEKLQGLQKKYQVIKDIRGMGVMIGMELTVDGAPLVEAAREKGLLINCTQGNVLRVVPAMTVTRKEIDHAIHVLDQIFVGVK